MAMMRSVVFCIVVLIAAQLPLAKLEDAGGDPKSATPEEVTVAADEAAAAPKESFVVVLDASNFTQFIKEHAFIVVEFYAPWCGHCKRLAPEYEKAAEELKSNDPPIILAKVDADEETNKPLAAEYGVSGFPTLKIIENKGENVRDYKGPREAAGIVAFLKKQTGPASEELTSVDQVASLLEENDVVIVGVFEHYESEEFFNFTKAAEPLRSDYAFVHTSDVSLLPIKIVTLVGPAVRLFKTFDEGFNDIKDFSVEALTEFYNEASFRLVTELNLESAKAAQLDKFFNSPESKVFLFANLSDSDANEYKEAFKKLANFGKGKGLRFMIANAEDVENALQHFGIDKEGLPAIIVQDTNNKKFVLDNAKPSELEAWLQSYLDGKLEERVKSDPIPETNDKPVKVIVTKSLNDFITSGKNVLLEFYAPWCGHCKALEPTYEEVAVHFQDDHNIIVAKMDATTNDVPSALFDVRGFPTIYLHSATGVATIYDGERSKDELIKFVNRHRSPAQEVETVKDEL
ncbi:hypothetical protein O6H91_08G104900 [Diphasiastrum complanatum]|uniref:Uncharacterized protein n=1 Tax=Diphasiastrum complanatum TaxID=34168 RepID=A0ACC2D0M4_DIPCM|nr:hypothetical protein O6H91_08G104900 [Diphasiastrum complanatum]